MQELGHSHRISVRAGLTYIRNATAQNAEAIHSTVRTATAEVVSRVGLTNVRCHWAAEVCIIVACRGEIEVVDSSRVCSYAFVIKVRRKLDGAAYINRSVSVLEK